MNGNEIIRLEDIDDFNEYRPVIELAEDIYLDNQFCVLNTKEGNIAFSYYDLGIAPSVVIHNQIVFLGSGSSYYVINLLKREILYKCCSSIIYDIVKCNLKAGVLFVGEMSLICFSLDGQLIWKNDYINVIYDWIIAGEEIAVVFENGRKMSISFENGNGVVVT